MPNMVKNIFLLINFLASLFLFLLFTPIPAYASFTLNEEFNNTYSEPTKWQEYLNGGEISFSLQSITLSSNNSDGFPYIVSNQVVFPENNFYAEWKFKYLPKTFNYGAGIAITDSLPPNRTTSSPTNKDNVIFNSWVAGQKIAIGFNVCAESNPGCISLPSPFISDGTDFLQFNIVRVEYKDQKYYLYYNNNLIFTSAPTSRIPKYFWLGNPLDPATSLNWPSFEVDYIHVGTIEPSPSPSPSPSPGLSVPFFSQRDPQWANQEYDYASDWAQPGKTGIKRWGCALTSAAMILKYHGFDRGPNNQITNPLYLNQYLIDNKGYKKDGGVIWGYFTKYARDAKTNGYVSSALPSLKFDYPPYNLDLLKNDIEATNPPIINIVMDNKGTPTWQDDNLHFVTANEVDEEIVHINDPLDLLDTGATLNSRYADKTYQKLARFIKANSDLSYVWLYLYSPQINLLVEYSGQRTGVDKNGNVYQEIPHAQYFEEGVIADADDPGVGSGNGKGTKVFMLPKPSDGEYKLIFSGQPHNNLDFELHLFDQNANVRQFSIEEQLNNQGGLLFTLDYSSQDFETNEPNFKEISFSSLIQEINNLYNTRKIKKLWLKEVLINMTQIAERLADHRRTKPAIAILHAEIQLIKAQSGKAITQDAAQLLQTDIQTLINSF